MATTYTSASVAAGVQARDPAPNGLTAAYSSYALTGALVVNDVIQMIKIQKGMRVYEVILSTPDLDTDGTPAVVLAVGDGDDDDRFITGSTAGQAGGMERLNAAAGLGYQYTADDTIDIKVTTAPDASATTGTLRLCVLYAWE